MESFGRRLTVDENDLTYCKAYLSDGGEIGILSASSNWQTKHDLKTRKIILSLKSKKLLVVGSQQDIVQVYLDDLSTRKKTKSKDKPIISPRAATEATRVARVSGLPRKIMDKKMNEPLGQRNLDSLSSDRKPLMFKPMPDLNELLKGKK
ncbi:MAG: hypothetical protein U1C48_07460 [Methylotenera sp.]|nr:hypothetical protein [Methylotenera sp.]